MTRIDNIFKSCDELVVVSICRYVQSFTTNLGTLFVPFFLRYMYFLLSSYLWLLLLLSIFSLFYVLLLVLPHRIAVRIGILSNSVPAIDVQNHPGTKLSGQQVVDSFSHILREPCALQGKTFCGVRKHRCLLLRIHVVKSFRVTKTRALLSKRKYPSYT